MVSRMLALCCALALTSTALAQESADALPTPVEQPDEGNEPTPLADDTSPAPTQASPPVAPRPAPTQVSPSASPQPAAVPTPVQPAAAPAVAAPAVADEPPENEAAPDPEDEEDSYGVMYIRLQGGLSYANLLSFNQDNFIPEAEESSGVGPFGGLAVGFRVYWFSIGANATFGRQGGFDLGTVGAELAFHIPIPVVQPYVRLAAGYAWVGRYDFQNRELSETDIFGLTMEAGAGIDIKLARHLSIGAGFDAAFLNLTRQELGSTNVTGVDLEENGDALGFQLRAHAHLTIHI